MAPVRTAAPPRSDMGDIRAERYIPPAIVAFLNDRRVDPALRAFLLAMAGRKPDSWTVAELQQVTAVVPALTEIYVSTATLSEFYTFMGLDPTSLFDPQLGSGWQTSSTAFDPRNYYRRRERCVVLSELARTDPTQVKLQDLLNCPGENSFGE